jgi:hypothetical protein
MDRQHVHDGHSNKENLLTSQRWPLVRPWLFHVAVGPVAVGPVAVGPVAVGPVAVSPGFAKTGYNLRSIFQLVSVFFSSFL